MTTRDPYDIDDYQGTEIPHAVTTDPSQPFRPAAFAAIWGVACGVSIGITVYALNIIGPLVAEAIVWWVQQGPDSVYIRCFVPGGGV